MFIQYNCCTAMAGILKIEKDSWQNDSSSHRKQKTSIFNQQIDFSTKIYGKWPSIIGRNMKWISFTKCPDVSLLHFLSITNSYLSGIDIERYYTRSNGDDFFSFGWADTTFVLDAICTNKIISIRLVGNRHTLTLY